jgi:hypothetical protein
MRTSLLALDWTTVAPYAVTVGILVVAAVAVTFLAAILLSHPRRARLPGVKRPDNAWGTCPGCHHATPPNALTCVHCGLQLRPAHRDVSYEA